MRLRRGRMVARYAGVLGGPYLEFVAAEAVASAAIAYAPVLDTRERYDPG